MRSRIILLIVVSVLASLCAVGAGASALASPAPVTADATPTPAAAVGGSTVTVTIPSSAANGGGGIANTGGSGAGSSGGAGAGSTPTSSSTPTPVATPPTVPGTLVPTSVRLSLNRKSYGPGTLMIATGKGFAPHEQVRFVIYPGPTLQGDFTANAKGVVVAKIVLSTDRADRGYTLEAFGWTSHRVASAPFEVTGKAGIGSPNPPWWIWIIGCLAVLAAGGGVYYFAFVRPPRVAPVAGAAS